jgi:predicted phosphate transport protein (TIGR00153 family)
MAFTLLPKDTSFFDLFDQLAGKVLDAARALEEMLERWDKLEVRVREMKDLEHECDAITHRTFDKLNLTFITPLEREDIHELASRLDDIVDHIDSTASRLVIYGVKKPTDEAKLLAQVLTRTCIEVQKAVAGLRNLKDPALLSRISVEINRLENESDDILRLALKRLFERQNGDVLEVIKLKEIYEKLESAVDRCEDVANVIQAVVLRHT